MHELGQFEYIIYPYKLGDSFLRSRKYNCTAIISLIFKFAFWSSSSILVLASLNDLGVRPEITSSLSRDMIEGRFSSSSDWPVSEEKLRYFIIPGQVIQSSFDDSFGFSDTSSSFKYNTKITFSQCTLI